MSTECMLGSTACLHELLQLLITEVVSIVANKVVLACMQVERQSLLAW